MDVCIYDLASLQHRSTNPYENLHVYETFYGEWFCAVIPVAALHQVSLQHLQCPINQELANMIAKKHANLALLPTFRNVFIKSPF
ncbi:hypothetical protein TNCV_823881 [Trichonephila clavipes]|nr:hypothetical protein TNCV_823881 [Trichonephila clavipes]